MTPPMPMHRLLELWEESYGGWAEDLMEQGFDAVLLAPLGQHPDAAMAIVDHVKDWNNHEQRMVAAALLGFVGSGAPDEHLMAMYVEERARDEAARSENPDAEIRKDLQAVVDQIVEAAIRWCRDEARHEAGLELLFAVVQDTVDGCYWRCAWRALAIAVAHGAAWADELVPAFAEFAAGEAPSHPSQPSLKQERDWSKKLADGATKSAKALDKRIVAAERKVAKIELDEEITASVDEFVAIAAHWQRELVGEEDGSSAETEEAYETDGEEAEEGSDIEDGDDAADSEAQAEGDAADEDEAHSNRTDDAWDADGSDLDDDDDDEHASDVEDDESAEDGESAEDAVEDASEDSDDLDAGEEQWDDEADGADLEPSAEHSEEASVQAMAADELEMVDDDAQGEEDEESDDQSDELEREGAPDVESGVETSDRERDEGDGEWDEDAEVEESDEDVEDGEEEDEEDGDGGDEEPDDGTSEEDDDEGWDDDEPDSGSEDSGSEKDYVSEEGSGAVESAAEPSS